MTLTPPTDDQIRRCAKALAKLHDHSGEWNYLGWLNHARELLIEAAAVRYAMEGEG